MTNVLAQQWSRDDTLDRSEDMIALRFERQAVATPDELAIVTDESSLTYRELDLRASSIGAALASHHFPSGQPVILYMKDDASRIAAMLGTLKANRIFIPLAANSPQKWVTQVIEDSGAALIITDSSTSSIAKRAASDGVTVMEVEQVACSSESLVAHRSASPDDTAYIVYTSGSTGRPKGVAASHRRLIRASDIRNRVGGVGGGDRYASLRSSGVASGIRNSLSPLLSGACLFPFDLHRHGLQKLASWLITNEITYITFPSSLLRSWLALLSGDVRFPALRFVGATSERLYAEDVIRLSQHLEGDWRIGHSYSSTESGTVATQVFSPSRLPEPGVVTVGRPVDGVEVSIKDDLGALVPTREIGEIIIRSRFLSQGYWNNPVLTSKAFQTDPLDHAIRIYQTGDLGRWRNDGTLELVGRKGRRVRLRGYNVEPFHVESELMRQPGVTDAVVLLYEPGAGQEPCLVGYIAAPGSIALSAIRERLAERLPAYMVPSHIVVLDSFPIASSGKIDRDALPPPYREETRIAVCREPTNDRERELLAIWQEVLKVAKISVDDDFFELGGTSLQVLTVFAKIEARLGCSLSPTTIIQAPTIARLVEFIRGTPGVDTSQSLMPLRESKSGLPLFLVHGRFYFVLHYRHLLSDLKSDRPIFGLQPPPLDGKHRIGRTLESMAAECVTQIRRVQPHGPYLLAGHSFGGRVSFEIAQQLIREGERISFLGLIDTSLRDTPDEPSPWVPEAVRFSRRVRGFGDFLFRLRWIRKAVWFRLLDHWLRLGRSIPYEHRFDYYDWLCVRANRAYVAKPYPGHVTMFSSEGNSERKRADWAPLARGGLTVLEVPAGHIDMILPPYSKLLAEHFDTCLELVSKRFET